ncbi:hypothetical protein [Microbaculum sp. FT89]|uniref:hypothetical protein n=1 Tax=Microbaculum sp. FT89 TaxID=3447298 RepID=UPI003F53979B
MRATISALLLVFLFLAPGARADAVATGIAGMPAEVITLRTGGEWRGGAGGGGTGYYRFVLARSPVRPSAARLFVQWIERRGASEGIVSSIEVAEIARTPTRITDLRLETVTEGTNAFVDVVDLATGAPDELMLMLGGPGAYQLTELGN